jgi:hypothetical protein
MNHVTIHMNAAHNSVTFHAGNKITIDRNGLLKEDVDTLNEVVLAWFRNQWLNYPAFEQLKG